jgi:hypothetical protein
MLPSNSAELAGMPAGNTTKNTKLLMAMNAKLNAVIKEEVGVDDGSSMGLNQDTEYAFTKVDI